MALRPASRVDGKLQAYGKRPIRLTTITVVVWFVVIFGFPLGAPIGAQGALIVFVILIFNDAHRLNKADVECGVQEEPV